MIYLKEMKYLFELSKEHDTIPKNEVFSILKAEEIKYELIEENQDLIIIDTKSNLKVYENLFAKLIKSFEFDLVSIIIKS